MACGGAVVGVEIVFSVKGGGRDGGVGGRHAGQGAGWRNGLGDVEEVPRGGWWNDRWVEDWWEDRSRAVWRTWEERLMCLRMEESFVRCARPRC
jgi:hypothetical protein